MLSVKIREFKENQEGVAAIEAAFLLPVFVPLLIGVFEILLFVFNSNMLDNAVRTAVQEMRLGQSEKIAKDRGLTAKEYYKVTICEKTLIVNCQKHINVNLEKRVVTRDAIVSTGSIIVTDVSDTFLEPSSIILITATTRAPGIGFLSYFAGKEFLTMTGSQAFITEPFSS